MPVIVNVGTGEMIDADHYALAERGMPEGYRLVCDVPAADLVRWLRSADDGDAAAVLEAWRRGD